MFRCSNMHLYYKVGTYATFSTNSARTQTVIYEQCVVAVNGIEIRFRGLSAAYYAQPYLHSNQSSFK